MRISCSTDKIYEDVVASDPDNIHSLEIDYYTKVICEDIDGAPAGLVMRLVEEPPPMPNGSVLIGSAYNFTANYRTSACGQPKYNCSGVTFSKNITLTLGYDSLPEGVSDLAISYCPSNPANWIGLICDVDEVGNTITTSIDHLASSTFAITGVITPLAPIFSVSNLSITQQQISPNETVEIAVRVSNTGEMEGNYTVVLKIGGVEETSKTVSIGPGESQIVSFSAMREDAGVYSVSISGLTGSFTVVPPLGFNNWLIICPIIAVITIVAVILFIRRWRRYE